MKTKKATRSDWVEQALRWMLGIALVAAVGWAWAHNARGDGTVDTVAGWVQRS